MINPRKIKNIKDIFPILSIDSSIDPKFNIIVSKNADLTIAFEVTLPEVFTLSSDSYNAIHDTFVKAIRVLPVGYILHKQDWYFEDIYVFNPDAERYATMDRLGIDNEQHFSERPFMTQKCYLFITLPSADVKKRSSLNSSILKRQFVPKQVLDKSTWTQFIDILKQFTSILNNSKFLSLKTMTYEDLAGERGYYQQYFTLNLRDNTLGDITIGDKQGTFKVGNNHTYTYSINDLQDFPQEVVSNSTYAPFSSDAHSMPLSFASPLGILLPFNHIYNQVMIIENGDALTNRLTAENKRHQSFAAISKENEASILFKDSFMTEMKVNGRKPVSVHYNILTWDKDLDIVDENRSNIAAALSDLGFTPRQAVYDAETLFWSCLGGNMAEIGLDNLSTVFVEEAVSLMTFEENYKDNPLSPYGIRLIDRFGKPIMFDPFIDGMKMNLIANRNFLIVGPSGSGKSFMTNNMMYYMLNSGFHAVIVDVGNSYKRLCQYMGGRYITFEANNPLSFNPFFFKNNITDSETEQSIAELLISLWKSNKEAIEIAKSEETSVSNMVHYYYEHLRKLGINAPFPCFDNFYEFAKEHYTELFKQDGGREKDFDLDNFLYVLKVYYKDGTYGYLLNSRTNIDLVELPFVVFELDNIKDHPVLFPVVTIMIMTTYIRKLMTIKGHNLIKTLVIEEAWKALSKPAFAGFLLWAFKTVRKHNGAMGVVTQEIDDLVGNQFVKDAIINNADTKFLLDQRKYANRFGEVQQVFGLSDNQSMQVLSVGRTLDDSRKYREMCVLMGDHAKVYGIEVSATFHALFTTDKTDVEQINELSEKMGSTTRGVKAFARGERIKV